MTDVATESEEGLVLSGDQLTSDHEGLPAVLLGQWEVPGHLHLNRRSKQWTLTIPRPWRKDRRPDLLPIWSRDRVRLEPTSREDSDGRQDQA